MKYRKFCKNPKCGKAFMGTKTQQYCSSECRVPTYKPKKKVVKKTKPCTIDEIATKAKALGMSYGKYIEMLTIEEQRKQREEKERKKK